MMLNTADNKYNYQKNSSAAERPTLCPICCEDVVTHFPRHLFRHHNDHEEVKLLKSLKPGSSERRALLTSFRKRGNFRLTTKKNVVNPVRSSKNPNAQYFVCTFCLGHYSKKHLHKHVKICKDKPANVENVGKRCLSESQTFMALNQEYLRTSPIKKVFDIMRADNISEVAKNDPLIYIYGESLLLKYKGRQSTFVVSNKIREMARMLIAIKSMDDGINDLFNVLRPEMFGTLLSAVKIISGYDDKICKRIFKAPSLAMYMGNNLKVICDVAVKIVIDRRKLPKIHWEDSDKKVSEIKDLRKVIEEHWCKLLKIPKERK